MPELAPNSLHMSALQWLTFTMSPCHHAIMSPCHHVIDAQTHARAGEVVFYYADAHMLFIVRWHMPPPRPSLFSLSLSLSFPSLSLFIPLTENNARTRACCLHPCTHRRMADKDRKNPLDLTKAERMLRKASEIVLEANMTHPRAFSKLALFLDEVLFVHVLRIGLFASTTRKPFSVPISRAMHL
jgi:hypothetical protein